MFFIGKLFTLKAQLCVSPYAELLTKTKRKQFRVLKNVPAF